SRHLRRQASQNKWCGDTGAGACPLLSAYADTSFLASLYTPDANSREAAPRMVRLPLPVFLTPLGELELINALQLRLFRRELRQPEIRAAYLAFRTDLHNGVMAVKPLPEV